jgi:hypothetical protein
MPGSINISAGQMANSFTVTAANTAPPQSVVITATSANSVTVSLGVTGNSYQITSFTCTPTTIIPAQAASCSVYISANAPTGGLVATVSSSSADLAVPSSVTITATNNNVQFNATASAQTANLENVTVTVTVQQIYTSTASITINPYPAFYLRGNNVEISSLANGATVTPTSAPGNWTGTVGLTGTGYLAFNAVTGTSGVSFNNGGPQTTNSSYINFKGAQAGQVFNSQGRINLQIKSAYSFAQRQALPQSNARYAFSVYDDSLPQFAFYTYTGGGSLTFAFMACGTTGFYTVPAGQEDTTFGAGVVAQIQIAWTNSSATLSVNGTAVATSTFSAAPPNWSVNSIFTVGSNSTKYGGGNASDDAIAEIQIR